MTITAKLFDGTELQFPDGTDPAVIARVAKEQTAARNAAKPATGGFGGGAAGGGATVSAPPAPDGPELYARLKSQGPTETAFGAGIADIAKSGGSGLVQGALETAGLPGTAAVLSEAGARKIASMLGMDMSNVPEGALRSMLPTPMQATGADYRAGMSDLTGGATEYEPKTTAGEYSQTIGQFIGGGSKPSIGLAAGLSSEAAGQLTEGTAFEPLARFAAGMVAPVAATGITNAMKKAAVYGPWKAGIKSADELIDDAGKLYAEGRATGQPASGAETQSVLDDMWKIAKDADIVTPKDRLSSEGSALSPIFTVLKDYAGTPMTPGSMRNVRDTITTALSSAQGNERRVAKQLLDYFDNFTSQRVPQFAAADKAYAAGMGGKDADEMTKLATARAGQYSQSGMENAIRAEARGLERKLITGKERGYSADEEALVSQMAQRPPAIADQLSKFAPTGPVPILASLGLGTAANAVAPGVGMLAAPAAAIAGGITKAVLTRNQKKIAELFNLLRRTESGELPKVARNSKMEAIARALGGAAAQ
jgi:hypothetical protein